MISKQIFFKAIFFLLPCLLSCNSAKLKTQQSIQPGKIWADTEGNPINAHGAGLLYDNGTYYWYGEYKKGATRKVEYIHEWECYRVDAGGVACYSSKDLINWKNEGLVLPSVKEDSTHDLHISKVIERPKVIYNENTNKYVMWMHVDSEDYVFARAGVAVSDSPTGPFTYIKSVRPYNQMSRDMTLFKDNDGRAYHIFSSENNATMYVALLNDDYLSHTSQFTRNFIEKHREAPAVLKRNNKYYMVTSGCTGWLPNEAEYAVADSMLGTFTPVGNPCVGTDNELTFNSQSCYIQPLNNTGDRFIFLADRWNKTDLEDSRYVWLPGTFENDKMVIKWEDSWTPTVSKKE